MNKRLLVATLALVAGASSAQSLQDLFRRNAPTTPAARPGAEPRPASPVQTPMGQEQGRAAPTQAAFQPGRYNGPPRWGFDETFAGKIARLRVFRSGSGVDQRVGGDAMRSLSLYALNLQRLSTITFHDVMAQQAVPATLLDCPGIANSSANWNTPSASLTAAIRTTSRPAPSTAGTASSSVGASCKGCSHPD